MVFLLALLLLVPATTPAAESGPVRVELVEGLPDFAPLARKYESGMHAELGPGETFVWIPATAPADERFWLIRRIGEGTTLALIPFQPGGTTSSITVQTESGVGRELRLSIDRGARAVEFEWAKPTKLSVSKGEVIPDAEMQRLDGASFELSDLRGKWVVLNWWATSCLPCREEIPQLNQLVKQHSREDIVFVAIAPDPPETLRRFLRKYPFEYEQVFGDAGLTAIFGEQFPRHLVISPEGLIVGELVGGSSRTGDALASEIARARRANPSH